MAEIPSGTRFIGIATSVDLTERKSALLNKQTEPFTIEDIANAAGVGAQGPQGVQGPAGPLGPVGPAGLEWQGSWVSGTSYVADDAVGYGGASYFCILATSGTTTPNLATTNWALLASQGAQGIQGVQGPTGAQGVSSDQITKVLKTTITTAQVLQLFTTPITILNSNDPLTVAYPINVYVKRKTGTAYTLAASSFSVINDFGTALTSNLNPNPLANTDGYFQSVISLSQNLSGGDKNVLYKLKANTGNPTLGTGDLDVYVTYVEITL
jgi:hypothetical protein